VRYEVLMAVNKKIMVWQKGTFVPDYIASHPKREYHHLRVHLKELDEYYNTIKILS
jgi:hypothetical protein